MDNTQKPPIPPDLGDGICITFDIDKKTSQYRACIHDGHVKATFAGTHRGSYGEALAKAVTKWRTILNLPGCNNIATFKEGRRLDSN